jgi:hypothetical protein
MKLTKILESVISEIGDTSNVETYKTTWNKVSDFYSDFDDYSSITYRVDFTTGTEKTDNKYNVYLGLEKSDPFYDKESWYLDVSFGVEGEDEIVDYKSVVNSDKMYRVMATLVQIIKELIAKLEKEDKFISQIWIDPSKNFEGDTRRTRLYKAYIEKNMPAGSDLEIPDDMSYIKITLPEPK